MVLDIPKLLHALLCRCPAYIPVALDGNPTPGLVRILYLLRTYTTGGLFGEGISDNLPLMVLINCLERLMDACSPDNLTGFLRPAVDAGIIPVLSELLMVGQEPTTLQLLQVSRRVLLAAPPAESGGAQQWAGGLPPAIAKLLTVVGHPGVVSAAAETLFNVGKMRPDLLTGFQMWGVGEYLQRQKLDRDPCTAAAANGLQSIVDHMVDVS